MLACGSKSLPQFATCVPVGLGKGTGCNYLHWMLRISELYRKDMKSLWDTKSSSKGAPCVVLESSLGLHHHPYSSWQGPNSKKERLIQRANSTRTHFMLVSGSVWTTGTTSCCFSFHFQYPHISNLSNCFLLSKTQPVSNPINPQAPDIIG